MGQVGEIPAAVLTCSDLRLKGVRGKLASFHGIPMLDRIVIPGGVKSLVLPEHPRDSEFILRQIEILYVHHSFTKLYTMAHVDCAACNGNRDPAYYENLLVEAGKILRIRFPLLEIVMVFVGFDGVHLVESAEELLVTA